MPKKETRLEATKALIRTEDGLLSAYNVLSESTQCLADGCKHRATQLLRKAASFTLAAHKTLKKQRPRVNEEQSSLMARAIGALHTNEKYEQAHSRHRPQNVRRSHEANLNMYIHDMDKENKELSKRKRPPSVGSSPPKKSLREVVPTRMDAVTTRYHGPRTIPDGVDIDPIPPPSNLHEYTPIEIVQHILRITHPKGKRESNRIRALVRHHVVDAGLCGNIKVGTLYTYEKEYKDTGTTASEWKRKGRRRYVPVKNIAELGEKFCMENPGMVLTSKAATELIHGYQRQELIDKGICPETANLKPPHRSTGDVYRHIMRESVKGLIATDFSIAKSETRFTAETSIRCAISLAAVIAVTHFRLCPPGEKPFVPPPKATNGAKLMWAKAKVVHGGDVCCVLPRLVTSTDDMTQFIFKGEIKNNKEVFLLVAVEGYEQRKNRSMYGDHKTTESLQGIRVKLATTSNAFGQSAAPIVIVSGLSDAQMPKDKTPEGVILIPLDRLGMAGNSSGEIHCQGYLIFIRGDGSKTPHMRRFAYQNLVYQDFIAEIRKNKYGWVEGQPVPDYLHCCRWADGALDQLATDRLMREHWDELKIDQLKQNAARTGTEQAADLMKTYSITRAESNSTSNYREDDEVKTDLQLDCEAELESLKQLGRLMMKKQQHEAIVDFVCSLPDILCKSMTRKIVKDGFVQNGMIDKDAERSPDIYQIIGGTTRRLITQEMMDHILKVFPDLCRVMMMNGEITEDVYNRYDIPVDTDRHGNMPDSGFAITSEHRQRAKILNHDRQVKLRHDVEAKIKQAKIMKHAAVVADKKKQLKLSSELEDAVKASYLRNENKELSSLADALMEDFANDKEGGRAGKTIKAPNLKAFIKVRSEENVTFAKVLKSTVAEAKAGNDTLVLRAYNCRSSKVVMTLDDNEEEEATTSKTFSELIGEIDIFRSVRSRGINDCIFEVTEAWMAKCRTALPLTIRKTSFVKRDVQDRSNALYRGLWHRYERHLLKVRDRNHWTWKFFLENMSRGCSIAVMQDHVRPDVSRHVNRQNICLLKHRNSFLPLVRGDGEVLNEIAKTFNGVYLSCWEEGFFRSGKASKGFVPRILTGNGCHKKSAKLTSESSRQSRFYLSHPSKEADDSLKEQMLCPFEELTFYAAFAYDPKAGTTRLLHQEEDGVFKFTLESTRALVHCSNSIAKAERRLMMIDYTMELIYELALDVDKNLSDSSGFELFNGGKD